jgi:hypothetical protein
VYGAANTYGAAGAPPTAASPPDYYLSAGLLASDNVAHVPIGAQSDEIATVGVGLHLKENTRLLDTTVDGDFSDLDYLHKSFSNSVIGRFDGIANLTLIPERLLWSAREDFGQVQIDPLRSITPENRQNVSYFSTGPDLTFKLADRNFITLTGRYSLTRYQFSDYDSRRAFGGVSAGRNLDSASSISLNADTEKVDFDDPIQNPQYDRQVFFFRYEARGARTHVWLNLGGSHVADSGPYVAGSGSQSGPLIQGQIERTLSPAATFMFGAGTQVTDAADSFRDFRPGAIGGIVTGPVAGTTQNFRRRYVESSWSYARSRTTLSLSARWNDDSYDADHTLDLKFTDLQLRAERQISPVLSAHLLGSYRHYDYLSSTASSRNLIGGLGLSVRAGRTVTIALDLARENQAAPLALNRYHENRAGIVVTYHPR